MKHSATLKILDNALLAEDEDRVVDALRNLKSGRSPRQGRIDRLVRILGQTSSARVRNAAALALTDMRALGARNALVDLLARSDTRGSRGTLIYALEQLGADVPLSMLADIVTEESYEAREEALALIANSRFICRAEDRARAMAKLENARALADREGADAIGRALEYLARPVAQAAAPAKKSRSAR